MISGLLGQTRKRPKNGTSCGEHGNGERRKGSGCGRGEQAMKAVHHIGSEKPFAALTAYAHGHVFDDVKLAVKAVIESLGAFFHFAAAVDAVAVVGLHVRFLSVGVRHFGGPGRYTVIRTSRPERLRPHTI